MIKSEPRASQTVSNNGSYQKCLSDHHSQSSLSSQIATAVNQVSIYPHSGFKFSHPLASNPHQFGDVAPSALVMHGNHSPTEAVIQLTTATAAPVDYSTLGTLNTFTASHPSSGL